MNATVFEIRNIAEFEPTIGISGRKLFTTMPVETKRFVRPVLNRRLGTSTEDEAVDAVEDEETDSIEDVGVGDGEGNSCSGEETGKEELLERRRRRQESGEHVWHIIILIYLLFTTFEKKKR